MATNTPTNSINNMSTFPVAANVPSIIVNRKSVEEFLSMGLPFVIPEYQRPYEWGADQVETLFDDLWDFFSTNLQGDYFLGTVVCCTAQTGQELIDGQQRLTTLLLLLRVLYEKIKGQKHPQGSNAAARRIATMHQIEPTIWEYDKHYGKAFYDRVRIRSFAISDKNQQTLGQILATGTTAAGASDNYSKNYKLLEKKLNEQMSGNGSQQLYPFTYGVLERSILLPIQTNSRETALTIFSTINDRGLQLSDADIFKAEIYGGLRDNDRKAFIDRWNDLDDQCQEIGENLQHLFSYNMFYQKAKKGNSDSSLLGLRTFYMQGGYLKNNDVLKVLMGTLEQILKLTRIIHYLGRQANDTGEQDESWTKNFDILKKLHILKLYPNEYWRYPVIAYYLTHRNSGNFEQNFKTFLGKLICALLKKYLDSPTVGAVKNAILSLDVEIACRGNECPEFSRFNTDDEHWKDNIISPPSKAVKMLLLLLAYKMPEQTELLPQDWQVEHIFPKKYDTKYFPPANIDHLIPLLGNLTPLERKLNIQGGNGFFSEKQKKYHKSKIQISHKLSGIKSDWDAEQIKARNEELKNTIISLLDQ